MRTADGLRALESGVAAGNEVRLEVDAVVCKNRLLAPEADPSRRSTAAAPTTVWPTADYIVDRFVARIDDGEARRTRAGVYRIWTGLFTGSAPRWKNMTVPRCGFRHVRPSDRVRVATVILE
ncbi:MAG TPA: hypothetical protein VF469_03825 [Kofleriaceae bacterium]